MFSEGVLVTSACYSYFLGLSLISSEVLIKSSYHDDFTSMQHPLVILCRGPDGTCRRK